MNGATMFTLAAIFLGLLGAGAWAMKKGSGYALAFVVIIALIVGAGGSHNFY